MNPTLEKGTTFIWQNARLLDRAIFEYRFLGGSPARVLNILHTYQNDDGGFGNAIEPDVRAPESQPLFVEYALRTFYECNLRDPDMVYNACDYLARHADLKQGIPTIFSSVQRYPRAPHWTSSSEQPSIDRLIGLVGLVNWQVVQHPWLAEAVEACLRHIATTHFDDAHTILTAFTLLESVADRTSVNDLFNKIHGELLKANYINWDVPIKAYGLTPLDFAPSPDAYCRPIFKDRQIEDHLNELASHQEADGGWPILWQPPDGAARMEWRARKTVAALSTLRAYGRI